MQVRSPYTQESTAMGRGGGGGERRERERKVVETTSFLRHAFSVEETIGYSIR